MVDALKHAGEFALGDRAYSSKDNMLVTFKKHGRDHSPSEKVYNYLLRHWRDSVERVNGRFKVYSVLAVRHRTPWNATTRNRHYKIVNILAGVIDMELATIKPLNKNPTPRIQLSELQQWYQCLKDADRLITVDYDNAKKLRKLYFRDK